ncbi:MAG: DUF3810 domain-containing protein [Bacteroidia bacterium]|nr:DUF3810 domain-containing protein [Bacteroidia bacterium]
MNDKKTLKKAIFAKLIAIFVVILLFVGLLIIHAFESSAETWTRTYYRFVQSIIGPFTSLFPFSIAEIFIILFGVSIIVLLVLLIIDFSRKRKSAGLNKTLTLVLLVFSTITYYYSTAGVAYGRSAIDIPQYQEAVDDEQYVGIVEHFISDFNACASELDFTEDGSVIKPYTISEISELLKIEYARLESDYFVQHTSSVKPMFLSFLFREFNITGIAFTPTGEANINYLTPDSQIASTMAHEIAHTKGVMREQDANLVAAYILLNSDDAYLRYSGYFTTFYSIISLAHYVGDETKYATLYNSLSVKIRGDYQYSRDYWARYDFLDEMAEWFNNLYLKIVGNEGVSSYVDNPQTGQTTDPDTGETIVYISEYSPYQKLYFHFYFD